MRKNAFRPSDGVDYSRVSESKCIHWYVGYWYSVPVHPFSLENRERRGHPEACVLLCVAHSGDFLEQNV